MTPIDSCTAVIINFQTPALTMKAMRSFRRWYPEVPLLLVDNGSRDESRAVLEDYARLDMQYTRIIVHPENLHHGPAMDQALRSLETTWVLFLDSDCEVKKGGFLEEMVSCLEHDPAGYIVGKMTYMDKRGFDIPKEKGGTPYVRPICMVVRRMFYLKLPPFRKHGTPCLDNMIAAQERGWGLVGYPIEEYVDHLGRGTASLYGYGLGWRGKLNYLLHRIGL